MTRPLRIEYPGAWYHVMNRGRRKEKVFFQERDYALFLEVVEQAIDLFDIEIYSYALLPNHYHLLIRTPKGNLSRSMRHINGVYTQRLNKRHKLDGSLFRGRYKSILIEEEAYLLELVRYIHRNPLKAKLENQLGEYGWCSYRAYLKKKEKKEWLKTKEVLSKFSKYDKEALRELKSFVEKEVPKNILKRLESVNWPAIMGGEEFKKKINEYIKGKEIQMEEIPEYKREMIDKRKKQEEKDKLLNKKKDILEEKWSRRYALEKRALIYVLRKEFDMTLQSIAEKMGDVGYKAVSKQYRKAKEEVVQKDGCYDEVKRVYGGVKVEVEI